MTIRFMDRTGEQLEISIEEFAESLADGELWHLSHRTYDHNHDLDGTPTSEEAIDYYDVIYKPDAKALLEHLKSLAEVNEVFEYQVSFSEYVDSENYVDITFTRQGDKIVFEVH